MMAANANNRRGRQGRAPTPGMGVNANDGRRSQRRALTPTKSMDINAGRGRQWWPPMPMNGAGTKERRTLLRALRRLAREHEEDKRGRTRMRPHQNTSPTDGTPSQRRRAKAVRFTSRRCEARPGADAEPAATTEAVRIEAIRAADTTGGQCVSVGEPQQRPSGEAPRYWTTQKTSGTDDSEVRPR